MILCGNHPTPQSVSFCSVGEDLFRYPVSKASRWWVAKPIYQKTKQLAFRSDLVERLLLLVPGVVLKRKRKRGKRLPHNIAPAPRPDTAELRSKCSVRFKHRKTWFSICHWQRLGHLGKERFLLGGSLEKNRGGSCLFSFSLREGHQILLWVQGRVIQFLFLKWARILYAYFLDSFPE